MRPLHQCIPDRVTCQAMSARWCQLACHAFCCWRDHLYSASGSHAAVSGIQM